MGCYFLRDLLPHRYPRRTPQPLFAGFRTAGDRNTEIWGSRLQFKILDEMWFCGYKPLCMPLALPACSSCLCYWFFTSSCPCPHLDPVAKQFSCLLGLSLLFQWPCYCFPQLLFSMFCCPLALCSKVRLLILSFSRRTQKKGGKFW